jgi:nitrate reductase delta subunit
MSPLLSKVAAALRDARSSLADSSGSGERERSPRSERSERHEGPSPRRADQKRSLRSERSERHEGPPAAITCQAAALVLAYPEAGLLDRLDTIEAALAGTPAAERFAPVLAHLRGQSLREVQSYHVQEFDLSRRHALHLSYWTDGDTRRRGEVLAEIKGVYRESGLLVDTGGELPDYLPMVLEFAATDPARGLELLQRFRASLELIRLGLEADRLPHAGVLAAVCACLPGDSPRTRAEVQARYGEVQPVEFVGLDSLSSTARELPAFAGMTEGHAGMTEGHAGMTSGSVIPGPDPGSPTERRRAR